MSSISRLPEQNSDISHDGSQRTGGEKSSARPTSFGTAAKWSAYAVVAIFCVYRLATFVPQPIDSAGTLRPILYRWFHGFIKLSGGPNQAFSNWITLCFLALLIPPALATLNFAWRHDLAKLPGRAAKLLCSRWIWFASLAFCLVLCWYPTLLMNELNPDEGQFIASADKLFYDFNFFRSVDCGTSGPLNIYPLMVTAVFGFSPDYASSRVIVLIIIFLSSYFLYRTVAVIAAEDLARIAVLPFIGAFAVFKNTELIHYSSENIPVLLICVALYCSVRVLRHPNAYRLPIFLLGLIACSAFFAKMQAVPVVVAIAAVAVAYVYATGNAERAWRPALLFLAGAVPLVVLNTVACLAAGVWSDFWMSYIVANVSYAGVESRLASDIPQFIRYVLAAGEVRFFVFTFLALAAAYAYQRTRSETTRERNIFLQMAVVSAAVIATASLSQASSDSAAIYLYVAVMTVFAATMYFFLFRETRSFGVNPLQWFGLLSTLSVAAALFSIYRAHHEFIHYLLFLFAPLCAAIAWMLVQPAGTPESGSEEERAGKWQPRHRVSLPFVSLLVVLTVSYQTYLWGFQQDGKFKDVTATIRPPESDLIRSLIDAKAKIVVWGWTVRPFLGSGHVPATRDTNTSKFFSGLNLLVSPPVPSGVRGAAEVTAYYRKRFLGDLRKSSPELFIDAVGPTSWFLTDREAYRFEQFPEIDAFVKANYVHLVDAFGQRYLLRKDLASRGYGTRQIRDLDKTHP